ncbi:MAG: hypothetical protein ACFFD5_16955 [Candidatus Thorarchaeota archaeon]
MFLNFFKDSPKDRYVILLAILGLLIVLLVYILVFIPVEASVLTYGILDYEFAWIPDRVLIIFTTWGIDGISNQILAIYWDFLYIIGYVSLALGLILIVFRKTKGQIQTIGFYFILTPFLTGIFDIIENVNLLIMLGNPTSISIINSLTASVCALIKFCFLFAAIGYFLIALVMIFILKLRKS